MKLIMLSLLRYNKSKALTEILNSAEHLKCQNLLTEICRTVWNKRLADS